MSTIALLVLVIIGNIVTSTLAPHPYAVVDTTHAINVLVREPISGDVFALTNTMDVVRISLDTPLGQPARDDVVGQFESNIDRDGRLFGIDVTNPTPIASATDTTPAWTTVLPSTPGGIDLNDDIVVVALPEADTLACDPASGNEAGIVDASGMPWGLEVSDGALFATSVRSGELLRFDDPPQSRRRRSPSQLALDRSARAATTSGSTPLTKGLSPSSIRRPAPSASWRRRAGPTLWEAMAARRWPTSATLSRRRPRGRSPCTSRTTADAT